MLVRDNIINFLRRVKEANRLVFSHDRIQRSNATAFNRYSAVFRTAQAQIRATRGEDLGGQSLRILSFGCSTGEEIQTLRAYFPDATIFGCDIDQTALREARVRLKSDDAVLFKSDPEAVTSNGPYDLVFCASVLCRYPIPSIVSDLSSLFSFSRFSDSLGLLDEALNDGGLLAVYNSNYFFSDFAGALRYSPVESPLIATNGFVDKFFSDGTRCSVSSLDDSQQTYLHKIVGAERSATDADFQHCLYVKGTPTTNHLGALPPSGSKAVGDAELVFGYNPYVHQKSASITAGLYHQMHVASDDTNWIEQTWVKSSVEKPEPISFGSYWIRSSPRLDA